MKWLLAFNAFALCAIAAAQPMTRTWIKVTSRAGSDSYEGIVVDDQGNAYTCGYSVNTGTGFDEALVAKFDKNGVKLWEHFYPGTGHAIGRAIALDPTGGVVVVGETNWQPPATGICRIMKISPTGATVYDSQATLGTGAWADVAVDNAGEATATGYVVNGSSLKLMRTSHFSPTGGLLWTKDYTYPNAPVVDQGGKYAKLDSDRNIYICGVSNAFPTACYSDIAKYAPNGTLLWMRHYMTSNGFDYPRGFALGAGNSVAICMDSRLNSGTTYNAATTVRYDTDGKLIFHTSLFPYESFAVRCFDQDLDMNYGFGAVGTSLNNSSGYMKSYTPTPFDSDGFVGNNMEVRSVVFAPHRGEYYYAFSSTAAGARPTTIRGETVIRDRTVAYETAIGAQTLFGSTANSQTPYALVNKMVVDSKGDLYAVGLQSGAQAQDAFIVKYELGPDANNDRFLPLTGTLYTSPPLGVSFNDNQLTQASASLITPPAHGVLNLETDGTFTYMPDAGYVGDDSFVYRQTRTNSTIPRLSDATVSLAVMPNLLALGLSPSKVVGGSSTILSASVSPAPVNDIALKVGTSDYHVVAFPPDLPIEAGSVLGSVQIPTQFVAAQTIITLTVRSGPSTRTINLTVKPPS